MVNLIKVRSSQFYFVYPIAIVNYLSLISIYLSCELARSFLNFTTSMYLPEVVATLFCINHKILMFSG